VYRKHPRRLRSPDCAHGFRVGSRSCMRSESALTLYLVRAMHSCVRPTQGQQNVFEPQNSIVRSSEGNAEMRCWGFGPLSVYRGPDTATVVNEDEKMELQPTPAVLIRCASTGSYHNAVISFRMADLKGPGPANCSWCSSLLPTPPPPSRPTYHSEDLITRLPGSACDLSMFVDFKSSNYHAIVSHDPT
jgi:hypothetical protein